MRKIYTSRFGEIEVDEEKTEAAAGAPSGGR